MDDGRVVSLVAVMVWVQSGVVVLDVFDVLGGKWSVSAEVGAYGLSGQRVIVHE